MDIRKEKVKKQKRNPMFFVGGLAACLVVATSWYVSSQASTASVQRDKLLFGTVKQGDLQIEIEGYGTLRSDKQQLITSLTSATVQSIVLKPGALVTADSIIVQLANPELKQLVDAAAQELAQRKANLRQLKLSHQREILDESSNFAELEANYETARVTLEAHEGLVESGIVSPLDYKESVVREAQLKKSLKIHKQRTAALKKVHQEAINIQLEQIKQQQGQLDIAQNRLDRLTVRAGSDGVLQSLSVELGQSLAPGQEIALIGSVQDLIALVKVPQSKAQQILVGQKAIVDTRRDKIMGTVSRIDPVVVDNTVEVEIDLPEELPDSARPQSSVDVVVNTETLTNITYMERPVNATFNSNSSLFRVDNSNNSAIRTEILFGKEAGRYIEIINGAKVNDTFIISDLSQLTESELSIEGF